MDQKQKEKSRLVFPDINSVLCPKEPIEQLDSAMDDYRKKLIKTGSAYNILYANKLLETQNLLLPKNLISIKGDISQLQKHLAAWARKKGYKFKIIIQKRRKSETKLNDKIRLFLTDMFIYNKDITLDSIMDMLGIRIILCLGNTDHLDDIKICIEVLIEVIHFFTEIKGYNPMKAEPKLFVGFEPEKHPEVVVPDKDLVPSEYKIYIKDYYSDPKCNSYQSYHIVFKTKYGLPLEIQIRTFATHIRVEYIKCKHTDHDKDRYPDPIKLDRKNINLYGYTYVNGVVEDLVGLEKAIDPFTILY